ncbi:hypothetical protein ACHAWF_018816 [Thalassiosira exigua]
MMKNKTSATKAGLANMVLLAIYVSIIGSMAILRLGRMTTVATGETSKSSLSSGDVDNSRSKRSSENGTSSQENGFLKSFRRAMESDDVKAEKGFVPFLLQDGKLLCRRAHRDQIRVSGRGRSITEMIRIGLELYKRENWSLGVRNELPLLLLNVDSNGCSNRNKLDHMSFPRLTWSYPSPKYGTGWCHAIPVPTYHAWVNNIRQHKSRASWRVTFASQSEQYPWSSKLNKAVWRGSTTYNGHYKGLPLDKTPRGSLVRLSMERPDLVDAGFHKLIQQYISQEEELSNQTILTERMHFDDQMNYRAIFDVDGNNWSGRFPSLLCTNSVIIKIDPDYIEYFHHELEPMRHFVPASLENITQVAAYVVDKKNDDEMKRIVASAHAWCLEKMTVGGAARDFMKQLERYNVALDAYLQQHVGNVTVPVQDLIEC